jgi:signal transduction histidine kinase
MPFTRLIAFSLGCLAAGLALALALFVFWLHTPSDHAANAIWYLLISGLVSLLTGGVALVVAARYLPKLGMKMAVATFCGSAAALINVIFTPLLMFKERSDFDILVITLLFFVAIVVAFAIFVGAVVSRQLSRLRLGALRLAAGELGTQVDVSGRDEVADLARAFNRMSSDLRESLTRREQLVQERKELLVAVSHDLRTPLASIRAMEDGVVREPVEIDRYLKLIGRET